MTGIDEGISRQRIEFFTNGCLQDLPGASREIGSSHRSHEEGIACKDHAVRIEGHPAWRVSGGVEDLYSGLSDLDHIAILDQDIRRWRRLCPEHDEKVARLLDQKWCILFMNDDLGTRLRHHLRIAHDMVYMG